MDTLCLLVGAHTLGRLCLIGTLAGGMSATLASGRSPSHSAKGCLYPLQHGLSPHDDLHEPPAILVTVASGTQFSEQHSMEFPSLIPSWVPSWCPSVGVGHAVA